MRSYWFGFPPFFSGAKVISPFGEDSTCALASSRHYFTEFKTCKQYLNIGLGSSALLCRRVDSTSAFMHIQSASNDVEWRMQAQGRLVCWFDLEVSDSVRCCGSSDWWACPYWRLLNRAEPLRSVFKACRSTSSAPEVELLSTFTVLAHTQQVIHKLKRT